MVLDRRNMTGAHTWVRPYTITLLAALILFATPAAAQDDFIRPPAEMRFAQVIADEAEVLVAGQTVAEGLPYAILTDYIPYYPENYPVRVVAGDVELSDLVRTQEGHRYTILAVADALLLIDETRLREDHPAAVDVIVHAALDVQAVDLHWNGDTTVEGLAYGEFVVVDAAYSVAFSSQDDEIIYTDEQTYIWVLVESGEGEIRLIMLD